jgi:hypothetical protein
VPVICREQVARERHARDEVFDHRAHQARLGRLEERRRTDHEAIERELTGVVRHEQHPTRRGDVLDPVRGRAEVVAIEPAREPDRQLQGVLRQPERIVAELVAVDDERLGPPREVVVGSGPA